MAIDRSSIEWNLTVEADPLTGRPSRENPPPEVRTSGLKRNQPFPRQWVNAMLFNLGEACRTIEDEYTAADANLQQQITDELTNRQQSDSGLQQQITDETTARQNADQALGQDINDLHNDLNPLTGAIAQAIIQQIYPVGSLYTTKSDTSPATQLGFGTWTKIEGRTIIGQTDGDTDFVTIGQTGGQKTHTHVFSDTFTTSSDGGETLTIPVDGYGTDGTIPSTTASITAGKLVVGSGNNESGDEVLETLNGAGNTQDLTTTDHTHTGSVSGSTAASTNLPPYEVVYIWERTG